MIGDGSYLMLPGELATAVAEGIKIVDRARAEPRLRVDRRAVALGRLGRVRHALPRARERVGADRRAAGGAAADRPRGQRREPRRAGAAGAARSPTCATRWPRRAHASGPVVVHVEVDRYEGVPSYESWWDVPVAEVADRRVGARGARGVRARAARRSASTSSRRTTRRSWRHEPRRPRAGDAGVGRLVVRRLRGRHARRSSAATGTRRALHRRDRRLVHGALAARRLDLGGRPDPWSGLPDAVYLPPGTQYAIEGDAEVGLCSAPAARAARRRACCRAPRSRSRRAATARTSVRSVRS